MSINAVTVGLPSGIAGWKLLQGKSPKDFKAFSKDPILQRDLAYLRENLPKKLTAQSLLADRRLETMVLKAYGLDAQVGYEALMRKVLESNPDDSNSIAGRMTDYRYRQIARELNYGGLAIPEIPAAPSSMTLQVDGVMPGQGFTSASGSFGGIELQAVDLTGLNSRSEIAAALQAAFRKADGGRTDIAVTTLGMKLVITDAQGRGVGSLGFVADPDSTPRAYLVSQAAGSRSVAASGGPKVTDSATVEAIVQNYTQARFEESLGETSESLRKAVYAKRLLPQVTNWYSIIADPNLSAVARSALGLPDSFARINVDQQKAVFEKRMNIADFKEPEKLGKMLERYVAQSSIEEAKALSSSGVASLIQPVPWGQDSFNGSSAAALLSIIQG